MPQRIGELLDPPRSSERMKTLDGQIADAVVKSVIDHMRSGRDVPPATPEVPSDVPDDIRAVHVARHLLDLGTQPAPELRHADPGQFPRYMRKHCDQAQRDLERVGFRLLGDRDATAPTGQSALIRCFLSANGKVAAGAYALRPAWPGLLAWVVNALTGHWRTHRVVDVGTELRDGSFVLTMNTAGIADFDFGPRVRQQLLPPGADMRAILRSHKKAVLAAGRVQRMASIDDVIAMQTRLQEAKNAHRREIGFVTDAELRRLLGKHHDRFAPMVRSQLAVMAKSLPAQS